MLDLLAGVKVIELTNDLSGAFCAKLMADQAADTVKIEPPGVGDHARHEPPFLGGVPNPETSSLFLAYNTNKKGITLNLETQSGRELVLRLVKDANVVIESYPPGYLDGLGIGYDAMKKVNPGIIMTSITPYGQTGPYKDYLASDLVLQAMSGALVTFGEPAREPLAFPQNQAPIMGARNAVIATMAALLLQEATGQGQHIDVSVMESVLQAVPGHIHQYSFTGNIGRRGGQGISVMDGIHLETEDGYVSLTTAGTGGKDPMDEWADFLGVEALKDPKYKVRATRNQYWQEIKSLVEGRLKTWKSVDFFKKAMDNRFVVGVVQSPQQVLDCEHLAFRGTLTEIDHPVVGKLRYPTGGFLGDDETAVTGWKAAPLLGQHNKDVLGGRLGLSDTDLGVLAGAGVI